VEGNREEMRKKRKEGRRERKNKNEGGVQGGNENFINKQQN
jgi:hypothetical protein